ncbi:GNAT family N-acetyltransferase [Fictibacillus aquaticus]|uniref:GNAT family N-acetyltransferase n=1 Tax=Fictibacillus aquaticus TaxID=2021314 RepID=A0A235FDR4_9BACL|nr:GNAT family N-acetyltransferase [Fictibacillus aquaticus]OYD59498.1 GNAT family N-acetyltransferase [Fictibacillus aquaticus]
MISVKFISPEETYSIRHKVLRPNQKLEDCKFAADHDEAAFHLGALFEGKLISIASFYHETFPEFEKERQYRLRGMATLEEFRRYNAGSLLIQTAEEYMKENDVNLWWCNARTSVSGYYEKLGMKPFGEVFDLEPIGPHIVMYKHLVLKDEMN